MSSQKRGCCCFEPVGIHPGRSGAEGGGGAHIQPGVFWWAGGERESPFQSVNMSRGVSGRVHRQSADALRMWAEWWGLRGYQSQPSPGNAYKVLTLGGCISARGMAHFLQGPPSPAPWHSGNQSTCFCGVEAAAAVVSRPLFCTALPLCNVPSPNAPCCVARVEKSCAASRVWHVMM